MFNQTEEIKWDYEKLGELNEEFKDLIIEFDDPSFGPENVDTYFGKIKKFVPFVAILVVLLILVFI